MLAALLQAASNWSAAEGNSAWQTFAGNAVRNPKLSGEIDLRGGPIWTADLRKVTLPDPMVAVNYGYRQRRVAEDSQNGLLSYFPVFWRDAVLYCNEDQVFAVNLSDGRPVWPAAASRPAERQAEIFRNERPGPGMSYQSYLGAPRFTLTVVGNKLLARLGPGLTSSVNQVNRRPIGSCLVCLDLAAQGRVVWDIEPEGDEWAFEGTPISDGQFVYAALRRGGVRSRAHVVCYDLETGRQRWRQFVCSSDTPGKDQVDECSHHLLTLHQGVVYYNTNLGAFAALAARDGKLQWLATYDRGSPADEFHVGRKVAHLYRDLTPCVYDNGLVMFAPADSSQIFIVDAAGGRFVGATAKSVSGDSTEGAVHLLGVVDDTLIATGDKVWWISIEKRGRLLLDPFPQGHLPAGYGRGLLADGRIYWPTRDEIYVLDQRTGQMARPPIQLKQRGATGGNLFLQKNRLLIAGPDKLYAFELSDMSTRLTPMENTPAAAAVPRN
jgi:outer membrane protein assembly factor BamB